MKKLNRKGFTLIELLAVIVILAIVLVVAVPSFLNNIEQAREASLANYAKAVAESYNNAATQEMLKPGEYLKGANATETWQCISTIKTTDGSNKTLAEILDLSKIDINLGTTLTLTKETKDVQITAATCSAIRIKDNGSAEVLLVGASDKENNGKKGAGKFKNSQHMLYSKSSEGTTEFVAFTKDETTTK